MPSRYRIKTYVAESYYHIYNRGVNKMDIFLDTQDYRVFLSYLKTYLLPKDTHRLILALHKPNLSGVERDKLLKQFKLRNFHNHISLIAYCLMPNHFHFLIKQTDEKDLELFMRAFMTRYTQYFNQRYKRVGPVFQGRYQAVLIETDEQLLQLSRYIHRNPLTLTNTILNRDNKLFGQPSSYPVYLGQVQQIWVKPEFILQNYSRKGYSSYQSFVEDKNIEERSVLTIAQVALDLF